MPNNDDDDDYVIASIAFRHYQNSHDIRFSATLGIAGRVATTGWLI